MQGLLEKYKDYKDTKRVDQIIQYMQDDSGSVELSPDLKRHYDAMMKCDDLIRQYGSKSKVIPMLQKMLDVSRTTANIIFAETQTAFGSTAKYKKHYWVPVVMDWLADARNRAIIAKDFKSLAHIIRSMVELMKQMPGDLEDAKPSTIINILQYKPHSLGIQDLNDDELEKLKKEVMNPKKKHNIIIETEE
jgi:hypothetical protein